MSLQKLDIYTVLDCLANAETDEQRDYAEGAIIDRVRDAEDIIRRFAVGKRPDGTYNYSREAAEQQCQEYCNKYGVI